MLKNEDSGRCNACSPVTSEMKLKIFAGMKLIENESLDKRHKFFKCLSDLNRLKIILLLKELGELCVCELDEAFKIKQSTMSHHLGILRDVGLVSVRKQGRWSYYKLSGKGYEVVENLINIL